MADEITLRWNLTADKGNLYRRKAPESQSITLTASSPAVAAGVASIGFAAHEAIPLGDVAAVGLAWFTNLDATNYVELGVQVTATFYPFVKLLPGESYCFRLGSSAPYAQANTAAVKLEYEILDN